MKNKGLIIITVLITATVLLAAGIIYHQKSSKRTINKGIFGDGLQYVSQIKKDDPVLASAFTNDYLYQDERYSYVIDEEKGYVKRIQLKDSLDWDAIVSVARTQSGKEIQKKAESREDLFGRLFDRRRFAPDRDTGRRILAGTSGRILE